MLPVIFLVISAILVISVLIALVRAKIDWLARGAGLLCLAPTAWFTLFYAFVVRAYLVLGYWPSPYYPDPKDLGFTVHHVAIWLSFPVLIASVVVCALMLLRLMPRYRRDKWLWASGLAYLVTLSLWGIVVTTDPGRFVEWFLD